MHHDQALELLTFEGNSMPTRQEWVDFGCGSGTFTLALASLLNHKSHITAVDRKASSLNQIPDHFDNVFIQKMCAGFTDVEFPLNNLDGILMANSLHYIQDQQTFIKRIKQFLKPDGKFLIVEYDTDLANRWIPYPLEYEKLKQLFKKEGFSSIKKINEKPSKYNKSNLYSAVIRHPQPNS